MLNYNKGFSETFEFLLVPSLVFTDDFEIFKNKFKDLENDLQHIYNFLQKYKNDINKSYISFNGNFWVVSLLSILDYKVNSLDEYFDKISNLSDDEILNSLLKLFEIKNTSKNKKEKLIEFLKNVDVIEDKNKWNIFLIIQNPKESILNLISIIKKTSIFYKPIYDKYYSEKEDFVKNFLIEDFFKKNKFFSMDNKNLDISDVNLIPLSPIFPNFFLFISKNVKIDFIGINTRYKDLFIINQINFDEILKILSDNSRYEVLRLLSKNFKAKDIAKKLNISAAAVSYHTIKLTQENLLLINSLGNKDVKYKINKEIFNLLINKLNKDFIE